MVVLPAPEGPTKATKFPAEALNETVPSAFVFKQTGITVLFVIFQVVLFGTLVETGTALIHSVNERVESAFKAQQKHMPQELRPILGCGMLVVAVGASMLGLETLIEEGYGYSSWGFLFIYLIPLAIWWICKTFKKKISRWSRLLGGWIDVWTGDEKF